MGETNINRTKAMNQQKHQKQHSEGKTVESCANVFNSLDFGQFLSNEYPSLNRKNRFLSKDSPLPAFESSSVFKSRDAFSNMFSSSDWGMKFSKPEMANSTPPTKTLPDLIPTAKPQLSESKSSLQGIMSSKEWMPMNTLGQHIDVSYSSDIFNGASSDSEVSAAKNADDSVAHISPEANEVLPELAEEDAKSAGQLRKKTQSKTTEGNPTLKKKRKRQPRKKVVPESKVYVEPKDADVLCGRGGRSNHHIGNKRYREEVKNLQKWYLDIEDKDEKTDLSQCLVDYVKSYDGRFLEKDEEGWYEVPNIVARRKASQALREDTDPEKRKAKRTRFLKKKAEKERLQKLQAV